MAAISPSVKSAYSALPIDDQLTHGDRKGAVMILSLCFGGPEEADYAMCIKGIAGSTQTPFRQAGFLRPFCWRDPQTR